MTQLNIGPAPVSPTQVLINALTGKVKSWYETCSVTRRLVQVTIEISLNDGYTFTLIRSGPEVTMPDIFHDFPIKVSPDRVFEAISTPRGLDAWWTKKSSGRPAEGEEYELWFGPQYDWRAMVTKCVAPSEFELQILHANPDWNGTRVGFRLDGGQTTNVCFHHTGWPLANEHWRISCYCWAMYLRILLRYLEHGERVSYENRLDA